MAITDLAREADQGIPWQTCATCYALTMLPPDQADALRELLANPTLRYSELAEALAADEDYPLKIRADTLSRHARGGCGAREKLRRSGR